MTTKYSPYFLMFGREARYPSEVPEHYTIEGSVEEVVGQETLTEDILHLEDTLKQARENVQSDYKTVSHSIQGKTCFVPGILTSVACPRTCSSSNITAILPTSNITSILPTSNITAILPTSNITSILPTSNITSILPTSNITAILPTSNITSILPTSNITAILPTSNITAILPTSNITAILPTSNITSILPTSNITSILPTSNITSILVISITGILTSVTCPRTCNSYTHPGLHCTKPKKKG
ncbi:hypothetical protein NHX12_000952 [Muraenolepis orangiensis]|uniref:Uncharacterized protein n=1 Tax=Muraenolepis orangiensis TaxID=630683 RepID=A0A9Q0E257_9TELE|nr:hypothetical protein NHX12_000952 [Muraenolepis orangiensis]